MLGAHSRVPVYAYARPADKRKGFEGLSALVRLEMGHDPNTGALYLFTNRPRTRAKVLQFDGTGLTVYSKRLEKGRFAKLWRSGGEKDLELTKTELDLFLQGSHLVGRMPLSPPALTADDLRPRPSRQRRAIVNAASLVPAA